MTRAGMDDLKAFGQELLQIQAQVPFKISARGWCYQLETFGLITKAEFDSSESRINKCRAKGLLPIDFVAEDVARKFDGLEIPDTQTPSEFMGSILEYAMNCENYYTPHWWDGECYYIQMVVEKIDLKTLFAPVCADYHIPIATSKGWSSILQRAEYARRFLEAEEHGLKAVLLYFGDHDPDGLRISEFLYKNINDLADIEWSDGTIGYDPINLEIERFGLNADFIYEHNLTWIDNLITGSKRDLADPRHPNHFMPYVQDYLSKYGARKCEANALIVIPDIARDLCRDTIEAYLGRDAITRFQARRQAICDRFEDFRDSTGIKTPITNALDLIRKEQ